MPSAPCKKKITQWVSFSLTERNKWSGEYGLGFLAYWRGPCQASELDRRTAGRETNGNSRMLIKSKDIILTPGSQWQNSHWLQSGQDFTLWLCLHVWPYSALLHPFNPTDINQIAWLMILRAEYGPLLLHHKWMLHIIIFALNKMWLNQIIWSQIISWPSYYSIIRAMFFLTLHCGTNHRWIMTNVDKVMDFISICTFSICLSVLSSVLYTLSYTLHSVIPIQPHWFESLCLSIDALSRIWSTVFLITSQ